MTNDIARSVRTATKEILEHGKLELVSTVFAKTYVAHIGTRDAKGHAFVERYVRQLREAIPDLRVVRVTPLLVSGDTIAWRRTLSGTHEAPLAGMPPSGRKLSWCDMLVSRFEQGRIVEEWAVSELAEKMLAKLPRA